MSATDKRHNVKLETLTPVHIGSGNLLQNNVEFVEDNIGEDGSDIYIIDPAKVINLIGVENIDTWVSTIERGENIKNMISRLGKRANPKSYSKRVITNFSKLNNKTTLKECIHDGRGIAYIPGSSIKGAIRTAVLASLAMGQREELGSLINLKNAKTAGSEVEKRLFGQTPFENIFRFLHIGDAFFKKGCEMSQKTININITERNDLIDKKKSQLVEAIATDSISHFTIKFATEYHSLCRNNVSTMPKSINTIGKLFCTINDHTLRLVDSEIRYWEEESKHYIGAENYIDELYYIKSIIEECKSNSECVLRIGYGSGWRFITGAWTEELPYFKESIVALSRPGNMKRNYAQYDFPKSRRIGDEYTVSNEENEDDFEKRNDIFGFVKLTLQE